MLYYLKLKDDKHGRRWKVKQAVSLKAAVNCIVMAMATGSIGGSDMRNGVVTADVIRVNSDNTEAEAYKAAY